MMPSRGALPMVGAIRQSFHASRASYRSLSTAAPRTSPNAFSQHSTAWRRARLPVASVAAVSQLRHASWSSWLSDNLAPTDAKRISTPPPATQATVPSPAQSAASEPALSVPEPGASATTAATPAAETALPTTPLPTADTSAAEASTFDASAIQDVGDTFMAMMPEQLGYLHSIGIDYGWGPTSVTQWLLEHVHIYSGLPWWSSIVLTAAGLRIILLPLYLKSSDVAARQGAVMPITKPITDRMSAAMQTRNTDLVQQCRAELKAVHKSAGIRYRDLFMPIAIQGVFGYCAFKLLRAMANLPVPGLETGGVLWLSDLTVPDPFYLLPLLMAGSMHLLFRFGGESGAVAAEAQTPGMRNMMLYLMPASIVVFMTWQPAAVGVWLATQGLTGIVQARVLQRPAVREYLNLAPIIKHNPATLSPASGANTATKATIDVKGSSRPFSDLAKLRYQAPNLHTTPSVGASADPVEPTPEPKSSGPIEFLTNRVNDTAEGWNSFKNKVMTRAETARNNYNGTKSSQTKSSEFLKRAKAYEERAKLAQEESRRAREERRRK